jgi:hypothetical protein
MTTTVDSAVARLPFVTRAQALDELAYEQARGGIYSRTAGPFMSYFGPLALSADPKNAVEASMERAAINELDSSRFPESRDQWPLLRARLHEAISSVGVVARRNAIPGPHEARYLMSFDDVRDLGLGPIIEALTEGYALAVKERTGMEPLSGFSDLAFVEALLSVVNSLAPTAMNLYKQKMEMAALTAQRKQAEAQAAAARAQFQQTIAAQPPPAVAPPTPVTAPPVTPPARPEGGIAWYWIVGAIIAALGLGYGLVRRFRG